MSRSSAEVKVIPSWSKEKALTWKGHGFRRAGVEVTFYLYMLAGLKPCQLYVPQCWHPDQKATMSKPVRMAIWGCHFITFQTAKRIRAFQVTRNSELLLEVLRPYQEQAAYHMCAVDQRCILLPCQEGDESFLSRSGKRALLTISSVMNTITGLIWSTFGSILCGRGYASIQRIGSGALLEVRAGRHG
jgi:hypothetical protein